MSLPQCPNGCDNARSVVHADGTTWTGSDVVGIEIPGLYDGVAYWECPRCGVKWHRWPTPGRIRDRLAIIAPDIIEAES